MPPKPWHRAPMTQENSGEIVQQVASQDPDIIQTTQNDATEALATTDATNLNSGNTMTNAASNNLSSRTSPYGGGMSSYGGMGGMGSYGMGGLGGMGMMGMGGMGMYGMGGMGMMGMGANGQNAGFFQTLQMMQGMNFAISSLCQVAATVEQNALGIQHLFTSLVSLVKRMKDWG